MKKFVFRLATLLKFKESLEKEQRQALAEVRERLNRQTAELLDMKRKQREAGDTYLKRMQHGVAASEVEMYSHFFEHMRDAILQQQATIDQTTEELREWQRKLLRTMREVKTLHKLREAKHQEYLAEVAREEEKTIGDIVSFKVVSGEGPR